MSRDVCYRCLKSKDTCYCHKITKIKSYPEFVILLHSKERKMKTNTGRMVNLSLQNSFMFEGLILRITPDLTRYWTIQNERFMFYFQARTVFVSIYQKNERN